MPDFHIIDEGTRATFYKNGYTLVADGDACISCELCVPVCPGQALFMNPWEINFEGVVTFGSSLAIRPTSCIVGEGCEGACAGECPTGALKFIGLDPEPWEGVGDGDPDPRYCELYPDICKFQEEGLELSNWIKNQCGVLLPKVDSVLQSQAATWGMTVEAYVADKLSLIATSGGYEALGRVATAAGWAGVAYNGYKSIVAVSDGNLTANELLGIASTTLGVISLIPGVGTAVGLSGLAIISAGSLVFGLMSNSDLGKDTVVADWNETSICN